MVDFNNGVAIVSLISMSFRGYASVSTGVVLRNLFYFKSFVVCISSFYFISTEFPFVVQRSHSMTFYIAVQLGRVADFQLMVWAIDANATRRQLSYGFRVDFGVIATLVPSMIIQPSTAFVRAFLIIIHWFEVHVRRQYSFPPM